jgi:hypothetical protein
MMKRTSVGIKVPLYFMLVFWRPLTAGIIVGTLITTHLYVCRPLCAVLLVEGDVMDAPHLYKGAVTAD